MNEQSPSNPQYDQHSEQSYLTFHPYNILLTLLLISLSMIFLALTVSFIYSRVNSDLPALRLPWLFFVNTLILLASSFTMIRAKQAYLSDDTERYQKMLRFTMILSFFFLLMQLAAWYQLLFKNISWQSDTSAGYLYVISGLHFAHVIGGIPFLGYFIWQAKKYMKEPVSVLVYFSDPEKRLKLRLLTIYWHFLDGLWIYLMLFFLVNQVIK
jgi:cytochrome c oxidase subunit III